MPRMAASSVRAMCGFCVVDQTVSSSLPGSKRAITPRGSMAFGTSRWLSMRCEITTSACSKASLRADSSSISSVAGLTPVPAGASGTARLFSKASWITAGSPLIARSGSTTAGSSSMSTTIASAASAAR